MAIYKFLLNLYAVVSVISFRLGLLFLFIHAVCLVCSGLIFETVPHLGTFGLLDTHWHF